MPIKHSPANSVRQLKNDYLRELRERLIPWAEAGGIRGLGLGLFPLREPAEIAVTDVYRPAREDGRAEDTIVLTADEEAAIIPMRLPRIGFVLSGKADISLGPPATATLPHPNPLLQIATLTAGQALLLPAGVVQIPVVGSTIHWFHPEPEKAVSRIFWLLFMPYGILVHTCETRNLRHVWSPHLFAREAHLMRLAELLTDALRSRDSRDLTVAHGHLLAILKRVESALSNQRLFPLSKPQIAIAMGESAHTAPLASGTLYGRACAFIESHINEELSPELIARQVSISARHLNRIFQTEAGATVMRYVTAQRVAVAGTFLSETGLPISEIAKIVGIPSPSVFSQIFARETGNSPSAYRKLFTPKP